MNDFLKYYLSILLLLASIGSCNAHQKFRSNYNLSFEILPGGALALPMPLAIYQEGYPPLKQLAVYRTKSFHLPVYYSWRLSCRLKSNSWIEVEMNHLKLYLNNKPAEIDRLTITHGFNQVWINHKWKYKNSFLCIGIGPVIAHPESTIRGFKLNEQRGMLSSGYFISGLSSQLAFQKKYSFKNRFFFSIESKLNAAYARIKVAEGHANIPVVAIHGLFGLGYSF